jgi:hypothetical protein
MGNVKSQDVLNGIISQDWGGLIMVLWDRYKGIDSPESGSFLILMVLNFNILKIKYWEASHFRLRH